MGDESWREFRDRFPNGMTFRELIGYMRDDPVMKMRLAVLLSVLMLSFACACAIVFGDFKWAVGLFVMMVVVALIGSSA